MDQRNIIVTGFMGTGKTTVGRLLAERLNRPFVDMDEQIESHFGKSIPEIFAQDGEPVFRAAESAICRQVAEQSGLVLSTGGGALVNPANRDRLAQSGVIFCLTASEDAILARIRQASNRPLLPGSEAEQRQRIRDLLAQRRRAYAAIPHQVDTSNRTPEEIAEEILRMWPKTDETPNLVRLPVQGPAGAYPILIGAGALAKSGELMVAQGLRPGPVAIVTNPDIAPLYGDALASSLVAAGFEPSICLAPEGEQHKTLATIASLYDQFVDAGLDRRGPVVALGGGVVGDMAGFAAASYLRGVPFVQIPTTLLSMVDSSVGGKTGVDLPQGKNLVGAFKQAELVVIDTDVLATLPAAEFRSGMAEVVKHGIIGAPALFEQLEQYGPTSMAQLVADAVRVKIDVVEEDPFEQGRRATLNLGHTFGHALELASNFQIRHGEGVSLGLIAAANMAVELELCAPQLASRIAALVERLGLLDHVSGYSVDAVLDAMRQDKKRAGKTLRFIVPHALGDVGIIDDPGREVVERALRTVLSESNSPRKM